MRILVTGASGFVGRALVFALNDLGHHVVVVSRDPDRAAGSLPVTHGRIAWDPMREPAPRECFEGVEAVIHLAGESVAGRWTEEKKQKIRDSRVIGTRNLVEGMRRIDARPSVMVSASAIGFYGDRGDEELNEDSAPGNDFLATTSVEWEAEAAAASELGLDVSHLRIGIVLHPEGGALQQMLTPFRFGVGGPLGSGQQWWSWIHRADLVRMLVAAVEEGWSGVHNATSPAPERQKDFARALGQVLGVPSFVPAPEFALRLLFGEFADELLTSKKVLPAATLSRGFEYRFGTLRSALLDLLA